MRYLLDTGVFVWLDSHSSNISSTVRSIMSTPGNVFLLSLISPWELQIKIQSGKLSLSTPLSDVVRDQQQRNRIQLLSVLLSLLSVLLSLLSVLLSLLSLEPTHVYDLANLPNHHKDPFDRLLIAQARVEGLALITADAHIPPYPVTVVW